MAIFILVFILSFIPVNIARSKGHIRVGFFKSLNYVNTWPMKNTKDFFSPPNPKLSSLDEWSNWWIYSFCLFPIALLHTIFMKPNYANKGYKKCPFCAEEIKNEAIKCKHCGSILDDKKEICEGNPPFNIILENAGRHKISVIKQVRDITNLGLRESKDLVDGVPNTIKEVATKEEAVELKERFEAVGAKIRIEAKGNVSQVSVGTNNNV